MERMLLSSFNITTACYMLTSDSIINFTVIITATAANVTGTGVTTSFAIHNVSGKWAMHLLCIHFKI